MSDAEEILPELSLEELRTMGADGTALHAIYRAAAIIGEQNGTVGNYDHTLWGALQTAAVRYRGLMEDAKRYRWLQYCTAGTWDDLNDDRLRGLLSKKVDEAIKADVEPSVITPTELSGSERYDWRFWQDGMAGSCNIVTFNGEDIRPVAYMADDRMRKIVISRHNAIVRELLKASK